MTMPVNPAVTDASVEAAARALLDRLDAEARVGVAQLLADLDDAALVDDAEGYVEYVLSRVGFTDSVG